MELVVLARELDAKIITTDFNLNKVASLQGVTVLNVNDLANALKPAVLPGEGMVILIAKEGKEANQGVGDPDDGTMVVVEEGRKIVEKVDVLRCCLNLLWVLHHLYQAQRKESQGTA